MSPSLQELGIDRLSVEEKLKLIDDIWDSLTPFEQMEISKSERAELDRRLDDADANPGASLPWEEVMARLQEGK